VLGGETEERDEGRKEGEGSTQDNPESSNFVESMTRVQCGKGEMIRGWGSGFNNQISCTGCNQPIKVYLDQRQDLTRCMRAGRNVCTGKEA